MAENIPQHEGVMVGYYFINMTAFHSDLIGELPNRQLPTELEFFHEKFLDWDGSLLILVKFFSFQAEQSYLVLL